MQQSLDTWVESLRSTGGTLVPEKSNWFKMRLVWTKDKWKLQRFDPSLISPGLQMLNDHGTRETIHQLDASDSVLALDVQFSPSGQMKDQFKMLKDKASLWAESVRCGHLRKHEAWQALITTVFKTIEYPLPATTLSFQQCDEIVRPILGIGLPAAGICRNISRRVAFSSVTYKGLGLKHPFFTQSIKKLIILLDDKLNLTNSLIQDSLDYCAYECGLGPHFMLSDFAKNKHCVTYGWIASLWEFMSHYQITTHYTKYCLSGYSGRIMQQINSISKGEQSIFNYCRLYLILEFDVELFTSDFKAFEKVSGMGALVYRWCGPRSSISHQHPDPVKEHGLLGDFGYVVFGKSLKMDTAQGKH